MATQGGNKPFGCEGDPDRDRNHDGALSTGLRDLHDSDEDVGWIVFHVPVHDGLLLRFVPDAGRSDSDLAFDSADGGN